VKTFVRTRLGDRCLSALLLSGLFLCDFSAQAKDALFKDWVVVSCVLGIGESKWLPCSGTVPRSDRLSMVQIQSGIEKVWIVLISNPRWNASIGKRKELRLQLVTDWPMPKPWPYKFSISEDSKILSTTDASVEFMNGVADASKVEIKDDNGALWATVDMKDSASAIRAIVNCVREHPPGGAAETTISGTGFFVAPNYVVTNNHVVSECTGKIQARYPQRPSYTATISGQDITNDLVLLLTEMPSLAFASIRLQPHLGEAVATYGFPYSGVLSSDGNFTLGNITALSGIRDDSRFLQTSTPIQPGNSGGALLDMSASVVGVVVSQLNAVAKKVPQNVNFAIQPSMVMAFLSAKGVTPKLDISSTGSQRSPSEVADTARKFTVQVYCQGTSSKTATGSTGPLVFSPSEVADFGNKHDVEATPGRDSTRP
jgi:serine protease Do